MAGTKQRDALGRVSAEALRAATGRDWAGWLELLDGAGAARWDHKQIVAHLQHEHSEAVSSWWRQSVAVGYERARGKRAPGQTGTGFQVGVQRSLPITATAVWRLLTSRPDLWLGSAAPIDWKQGAPYHVPPGKGRPAARGEVRVVRPRDRLRMTWQQKGWPVPATLQLTLLASRPGTIALHAQLERLPDADAREEMRTRWRAALERIARALT